MIPEGWSEAELGELATFKSGGTPSKENGSFWGGEFPWVSAKDLKAHLICGAELGLTHAGVELAQVAKIGSVLILVRGMTLLKDVPIGFVTRAVAFNQDIKALIAGSTTDPLFLSYLLVERKQAIRALVNTANHGTGRLDTDLLKGLQILLPPLQEQKKIAEILSTWDQAIEKVEALIANAKSQKKALMQSLLTGKVRLPGFSGFAPLVPLSEIALIETGSSNREDSLDIGEYTFFDRSTDIRRSDRFIFDTEAIIIGGEGQDFVPKYFVGKFDLHQRAYALHSFGEACGRYVYYATHESRHLLKRYSVGSTVASLRMPTFQKVKIWLPPLSEQISIAELLSATDTELNGMSAQLSALRAEKSALMQQLLTGKRRVRLA
jgi:type I restriction enzyme, S subunit